MYAERQKKLKKMLHGETGKWKKCLSGLKEDLETREWQVGEKNQFK